MKVAIPKTKIVMKDKSEYLISREQGDRLQDYLSDLKNHVFVKLTELGETITTAEIKKVINIVEYEWKEPKADPDYRLTSEDRENMIEMKKRIGWYELGEKLKSKCTDQEKK